MYYILWTKDGNVLNVYRGSLFYNTAVEESENLSCELSEFAAPACPPVSHYTVKNGKLFVHFSSVEV